MWPVYRLEPPKAAPMPQDPPIAVVPVHVVGVPAEPFFHASSDDALIWYEMRDRAAA